MHIYKQRTIRLFSVLQSPRGEVYSHHRHLIHLSICGIYIALLQGNYSEALPAQACAKRKVLGRL